MDRRCDEVTSAAETFEVELATSATAKTEELSASEDDETWEVDDVSAIDDDDVARGVADTVVELAIVEMLVVAEETSMAETEEEVATATTEEIALVELEPAIVELELEATLPSAATQAKLIFCVNVPLDFGALKSHTSFTYGQQILLPTTAMSPLTVTSIETTSAPTLVPALSTNCKLVPA